MTALRAGGDSSASAGADVLAAWVERTGCRAEKRRNGSLRFAFHGRVSTEDWQDPVTSRARQRDQAAALVAGQGRIVAEFFDTGYSRSLAWARRPQAAALLAALADPDRGWDAVVIGEYERAFYGSQYASMAPLFEHYGIQLWTPEVGGRIDFHAEDHEQTMLALGPSSNREIARTRIRVRTAMATQTASRAATWAAALRTDTGWRTPGRTPTRCTPGGADGHTASSQTPLPRRSSGGCSPTG